MNFTLIKPLNQNKMKAKLIKTVTDNYILVDLTKEFYGEGYVLGTTVVSDAPRLSLKNCQAIERGYDLDELVSAELEKLPYTKHLDDGQYNDGQLVGFELGAYWGFQKALELMGDKKFSEEDMINAHYNAWIDRGEQITYPESRNKYFKSLQQTEWDVEIEMEDTFQLKKRAGGITNMAKPKLDADGCLILKLVI